MAKTMYAWSTFNTEVNEYGQPTNTIKPGDTISQSDLDVSDEEWAGLVESGAVREEEYPDVPAGVSPAEYEKQKAGAAVELVEAQAALDSLQEMGAEPPEGDITASDTPVAKQPAAATAAATAKDK